MTTIIQSNISFLNLIWTTNIMNMTHSTLLGVCFTRKFEAAVGHFALSGKYAHRLYYFYQMHFFHNNAMTVLYEIKGLRTDSFEACHVN